jgi:hypothetical protein
MMTRCLAPRTIAASLAAFLSLAWAGCADDGLGKRYPVRGKVTYNGKPVTKGSIALTPVDDSGRSASGTIRPDGSYEITTLSPGDGALPGKYYVTVQAFDRDSSKVQQPIPGGPINLIQLMRTPQKPLIPAKYSVPQTSRLTLEVKTSSLNHPINLTDE